MSVLFNVLFAWKCKSTHHKLALDALRLLEIEQAQAWQDCFLAHADAYLQGAKAPDDTFKDFKNHVLHVEENYWGGAPATASLWYARTTAALREQRWADAAYAAGVLSHYYSDPLMPLHTAQSEEEGAVHRPLEWSVTKSYEGLRNLLERQLGGFPKVTVPAGESWLEEMVRQGAALARPSYEMLIEHYDLARGVKDPPAGLDQASKECLARLLGHAASGFARILERAIAEAAVKPPVVNLTLKTVLATLTVPIAFVTRKLADRQERALVEAICREYQQTGKVIQALPEDDRTVRKVHAEEVLQVPLAVLDAQPARPVGGKHGQPSVKRTEPAPSRKNPEPPQPASRPAEGGQLRKDMPAEEAPSVGPRTAERLLRIGVKTVGDLLALDPADAARRLGARHITAAVLADWQAQTTLMCEIPGLRVHDAQILVGSGIRTTEALATSRVETLLPAVEQFIATPQGERVLRSSKKPDAAEVTGWIEAAGRRQTRAA